MSCMADTLYQDIPDTGQSSLPRGYAETSDLYGVVDEASFSNSEPATPSSSYAELVTDPYASDDDSKSPSYYSAPGQQDQASTSSESGKSAVCV